MTSDDFDAPVYIPKGSVDTSAYDKLPTTVYDPDTQSFIAVNNRADDLSFSGGNPILTDDAQADVFEVPIKVEETFEGGSQYFGGPVATREANFEATSDFTDEPEVFYIFYENEDDTAPVEVFAGEPREKVS